MVGPHNSRASGPCEQVMDPISAEIEAILRFHRDIEPKSLQELGFELLVAPSFSHILHEFTRTPRRVYAGMVPSTEVTQKEDGIYSPFPLS
ncbi:mannan endo-1,4-beta-mannosidase 8-like [Dorcoceras hygrometricum]|uniref:Mannan endo-1,4-beta-mannosidase 8-like n=1 Tax=Dorcoceras hygrometricum TaxID=472368 RepID=A0A2Z7C4Q9_9LAMI|nr:mannan endo-1,4-beta-mannosidase 8-like [Dorcoceras hygrometricum]